MFPVLPDNVGSLLGRSQSAPALSNKSSTDKLGSPQPKSKSEPGTPVKDSAAGVAAATVGPNAQRAEFASLLGTLGMTSQKTQLNQALVKIAYLIEEYSAAPGEELNTNDQAFLANLKGFQSALKMARDNSKEFAKLKDEKGNPVVLNKVIHDVNAVHAQYLDAQSQASTESPEVSISSSITASPSKAG